MTLTPPRPTCSEPNTPNLRQPTSAMSWWQDDESKSFDSFQKFFTGRYFTPDEIGLKLLASFMKKITIYNT